MPITREDFIETLQIAESRCPKQTLDKDVAAETLCILRSLEDAGNAPKVSIKDSDDGAEGLTFLFRYDDGPETVAEQQTREQLQSLATEQDVTVLYQHWGGAVGILQWLIEHDKGCVALLESQGYATYYERRDWIQNRLGVIPITISRGGESHESQSHA